MFLFGMAWKALIQRFENTLAHHKFAGPANSDERGMLMPRLFEHFSSGVDSESDWLSHGQRCVWVHENGESLRVGSGDSGQPGRQGSPTEIHSVHPPFELLQAPQDDPVHLREVGIQSVGKPSGQLADLRLVFAGRPVMLSFRPPGLDEQAGLSQLV